MRQFEQIKIYINECKTEMGMAGFLDGIKATATVYCLNKCPDEVSINSSGKVEDISICGMVEYLKSEVM